MTLDLKTVNDHPATLLERGFPKPDPDNDKDLFGFVGASVAAHWVGEAARALRTYETHHNVTFAALDNDALAQVREAYDGLYSADPLRADLAVGDLVSALCSLLGLDS